MSGWTKPHLDKFRYSPCFNGIFAGTIALVVTRGYAIAATFTGVTPSCRILTPGSLGNTVTLGGLDNAVDVNC